MWMMLLLLVSTTPKENVLSTQFYSYLELCAVTIKQSVQVTKEIHHGSINPVLARPQSKCRRPFPFKMIPRHYYSHH